MDILMIDLYWDKGLFGSFSLGNGFSIWLDREFDGISLGIRFGKKTFEKRWE